MAPPCSGKDFLKQMPDGLKKEVNARTGLFGVPACLPALTAMSATPCALCSILLADRAVQCQVDRVVYPQGNKGSLEHLMKVCA